MKCLFWFSLQILSEIFPIRRRVRWDTIINVYQSSREVPIILVRLKKNLYFIDGFSKKNSKTIFTKILSSGSRDVQYRQPERRTDMNFNVLLTVRLSITLVNDQLDAKFFCFIILFITALYMFRATSCSSSGGQIILIQHLVSSLSVSGRPVHMLNQFSLNRFTGSPLTESDDTRCCINTIWPPDDEHDVARNM